MGETKIGSVTVQFDTRIPAVYIYLREPGGFRAARTKKVAEGLIVDLDSRGKLMGVEILGPGALEIVFKKVIPRYHAPVLKQLAQKRRVLEEILAGAVT